MQSAHNFILAAILLTTIFGPATTEAKMYRWTDADGNVHYSDKIPAEAAGQGRTELNKRGLHIDQVAPAKTKEEYEREQELERLRVEQEALIQEQKRKDDVLLRSYRTEDDIIMARNGKLAAIDVMIKVIESNIRITKTRLDDMQNRAAAQERQGKKVDKDLENNIETTWKRLKQEYAKMVSREQDKESLHAEYGAYLARFRKLKNIGSGSEDESISKGERPLLETVVACQGPEACDAAWRRAKAYRALHSTTGIQISSETIVTAMPPSSDQDISINVSRIRLAKGDEEQLFLDLQCKPTPLGREYCQGDVAASIRSGFRPFLAQEY